MNRRYVAVGALPIIAGLGIAMAVPAQASASHDRTPAARNAAKLKAHVGGASSYYGSCNLVAPTTARVIKGNSSLPVSVTGGCALHPMDFAVWELSGAVQDSEVAFDTVFFIGSYRTTWDTSNLSPLGTRAWVGYGAADTNDHEYSQNAPKTTTKVGSWAGLQTKRSGNKITLDSRAVRFATSLDYNIPWAGQGATIQYRTVGSSIWTNLKLATTDSRGAISYSYTTTATRDYRVIYNEAAYIWGATSPTSRR